MNALARSKRLVVKIGSSILVDEARGEVRRDWLEALIQLAHAYQEALARHGITVAQVLLTLDDSEERRRYLNARQTMATLLGLKAIAVINENDTVATDEIRFGDNDRLGARVAEMISADTLVLLSDIDGLYSGDPRSDAKARHIPEIREITPDIEAMAGAAPSQMSNGGMVTKLMAGRIAMAAGCRMAIADGRPVGALGALIQGTARCSWFLPDASPLSARKKWIKGSLKSSGSLTVDDGAVRALSAGKSLLPAGVTAIDGDFRRGDVVEVRDRQGRVLARGLVAYAAEDARRIAGHRSAEIEKLLGFRGRDEMVHRDDLVVE
jgi:glutamate 5-kinase